MRTAIIIAGALALATCLTVRLDAQNYRYEAEASQRTGVQIASSIPGYSGTGYVTGFDNTSDKVTWQVDVPNGLYEMWVGYRSQYGQKGYDFHVDGEAGSGMFDQSNVFKADRAGLFNLQNPTNTFSIEYGWGYYDLDYVEFRPFTPPTLAPVSPQLVDEQANARTKFLMNYLTDIYGEKTLSGQQHEVSQNLSFPGQSYLNKSVGLVPAIRGSDFIEYSPSRRQFGSNPRNETEQTIAWAQQTGGVVSMMWHWNAPANLINQSGGKEWWRGFYSDATTFNLPGALANPAGNDYQLLLRDIDAIAVELQKFEDAGVPVVWRPLHEAQGGWFWWGAHGPDTFKQLWNLTYDRLTEYHGLHNLIWEFTSSSAEGNFRDWYPGDNVVDMIGLDIYTDPSASMSGQWYDMVEEYDGRKMIALSETGTLPNPDVMDQWGIDWSYFSPWSGSFVNAFTSQQLQATLGHEDVITLNELPMMPWNLAAPRNGDFNDDGIVDGADFLLWQRELGQSGALTADGNGDGVVDADDLAIWREQFGQLAGGAGGQATVLEPATGLLAGIFGGIIALCSRRSRR
ncbi:glycosyl hydrolase [Lacipirellula sp.]|uniref:glycosyl hydrolase n=1 Tax=Lacipirellula sp. TaxID=2691419 RepID=UPI003D0D5607